MDIKYKINFFPKSELCRLAPELSVDNFTDIKEWYDVLEEELHEQGFALPEGDISFLKEVKRGNTHRFKYNCAVVDTVLRNGNHHIQQIGIQYKWINRGAMTDLEKLAYALNHLRPAKDVNGKPEEESVKSLNYINEVIEKMRLLKLKNLK